jgi:hypothetical protein
MQAATLQQAVVFTTTQPADLSSDVTYLMKLDGFGYQNDTLVTLTPVPSEEGVNNSTYGGFAAIVSEYVSATVNLTYVGGKPTLRSSGLYASLVGVGLYGSSVNPDPALSQCNTTVGTSSEDDFSTTLVNSIRGLLWYVISHYCALTLR